MARGLLGPQSVRDRHREHREAQQKRLLRFICALLCFSVSLWSIVSPTFLTIAGC